MLHSPSSRSTRSHAGRFDGGQQIRRPTVPGKTLHRLVRRQQLRPRGVEMDVIAHALEIAAARAIHQQRFVAATEQMAEELVPPVEAAGVGAQKPFHPGDQIRLRRLDHEVKMIRYEDVGVNLPAGLGASLGKSFNEAMAVHIVLEDRLAPVAAIHDVVDRAGILDAQLAGHDGRVARAASRVNIDSAEKVFFRKSVKNISHTDAV